MAKFWRFLSVPIVLAVCLGLMLVPVAVPGQGQVALAQGTAGLEVVPDVTTVGFTEDFDLEIWTNAASNQSIDGVGAFLNFSPTYMMVNSITDGGVFAIPMGSAFNNTLGTIGYSAGTLMGAKPTGDFLVCTINCTSKSTNGISPVDFVIDGLLRTTEVTFAGESITNWSMVVNGTVIVGDAFNLTVTSTGCCDVVVGSSMYFVPANSSQTFIVPCPSVTLTANDTAGSCSFANWTVDGGAPTTSNPVIVNGTANTSHTAIARCTVVALATLEGNVTFPGALQGPRWVRGLEVRFFNSTTGNETAWSPMNATTNSTGVFNITGLAPGTYNISIKNWTCLSELNTSVTLGAGNTTVVDFGMTREGDSNNDDWIVLADRTILYTGWGTQQGGAGWNAHCDFNRDGWLTLADRTIMYTYWAQHGGLV